MSQCGELKLKWQGPFSWPGVPPFELPLAPALPGVYLLTFPYLDGHLVYAAGITRRSIQKRLKEHTRKYLSGDYTILDPASAAQGKRIEHWHGWGWNPDKRAEYADRRTELQSRALEQLRGFRVFAAAPLTEPRLLERVEAAVMKSVYASTTPVCDLADRGMQLSGRWQSEELMIVRNLCESRLYGLLPCMEI